MRRREFLGVLSGAAMPWPLAAHAQQAGLPIVGVLGFESSHPFADRFKAGVIDTGFVEGRTVTFEYRWAQGQSERLPALAAELVRLKPAVIGTIGATATALALKKATDTIPIVFTSGGDPIKLGLVTSFKQPSGNITGVAFLVNTVIPKQLEALHEIVPKAVPLALLLNPTNASAQFDEQAANAAAKALGRKLIVAKAASDDAFEAAFASLVQQGAGGLIIEPDAYYSSRLNQLAALVSRHSLPAAYAIREFAEAGGLMSYGTDIAEAFRQAGVYAGRILKGEKPADLPVEQSTKVELVINGKTAKTLGLNVPLSLLGRADEVIE